MIQSIEVYHLQLPLVVLYKLSFGTLPHFDTLWIKVELEDGSIGWGETTPLPGYSETTIKDSIEFTKI